MVTLQSCAIEERKELAPDHGAPYGFRALDVPLFSGTEPRVSAGFLGLAINGSGGELGGGSIIYPKIRASEQG